jgi:periplasmic protein TonB
MYADRRTGSTLHPGSMGMALAMTGTLMAGVMLASPDLVPRVIDPGIKIIDIQMPDPPPPDPRPRPAERRVQIDSPMPPLPLPPRPDQPIVIDPPLPPLPPLPLGDGAGGGPGAGTGIVEPAKPLSPPLIGPSIDQRHAADFQPGYPPEERRAGREGRVVVRVLVGVDGRVQAVEQVSATSPAFLRAIEERALAKWRFRPARRGDVPVEAWYTVSLRFELKD